MRLGQLLPDWTRLEGDEKNAQVSGEKKREKREKREKKKRVGDKDKR